MERTVIRSSFGAFLPFGQHPLVQFVCGQVFQRHRLIGRRGESQHRPGIEQKVHRRAEVGTGGFTLSHSWPAIAFCGPNAA